MTMDEVLAQAELLFASMSIYLNKIIISLVIIIAGFIIGKIIESILRHIFTKLEVDEHLTKMFGARRNYSRAIRRTIVRLIYISAIIIALQQVSLIKPVVTVLEFLAVVVILISFMLAGLDVVPNIAARTALKHRRLAVGDEVVFTDRTGVIQGTIIDMTMIDVRIKRKNGDVFFIPNSVFLKERITKRRHIDPR